MKDIDINKVNDNCYLKAKVANEEEDDPVYRISRHARVILGIYNIRHGNTCR
jgi:hypothetical protein